MSRQGSGCLGMVMGAILSSALILSGALLQLQVIEKPEVIENSGVTMQVIAKPKYELWHDCGLVVAAPTQASYRQAAQAAPDKERLELMRRQGYWRYLAAGTGVKFLLSDDGLVKLETVLSKEIIWVDRTHVRRCQ